MKFRLLLIILLMLFQPFVAASAMPVLSDQAVEADEHCGSNGTDMPDEQEHSSCLEDCGLCVSCSAATADSAALAATPVDSELSPRISRAPPAGVPTLLYRPPILA